MPNAMMQMFVGGFAPDDEPDAFTFTDVTGQNPSTAITSNSITVTGINVASDITVSGGTYSINGGAFTSSAGTVTKDDSVRVQVTTGSGFSTSYSATVTIGGVSDTFTATTKSPVSFSFTDHKFDTALSTSTTYTSVNIGSPAADRKVVLAVFDGAPITSVTVGGVTATRLVGYGPYYNTAIYQVNLPSGTTANVTVNTSAVANRSGIGVWAVYNAQSAAHATSGNYQSNGIASTTIAIPAGGVAIGGGYDGGTGSSPTFSWSGLSEQYEYEYLSYAHTGAHLYAATANTPTVSLSTGAERGIAVASFAPA